AGLAGWACPDVIPRDRSLEPTASTHPAAARRSGSHCARQARERRKRLETRKPFIVTLRVPNPARPSLAKQPEASLAWSGGILTAKGRQPVLRLCDPAPKSTVAGAFVVDLGGGHVGRAAMAWHARSYRGPRARPRDIRVAREPGRPCRLHRCSGSGTGI